MRRTGLAVLIAVTCLMAMRPAPAAAFDPLKPICGLASLASGLLGKACTVVQNGGRFVSAAKKLLGGHVGSAIKTALGGASRVAASKATALVGLAALGAWVLGGARFALRETAKVISETTTPKLTSSWFSVTYWRVAGIAALLTLPFLFAAAVQAVIHSDMALLLRAVFGYLPLALLMVSLAAPVTTLLLSGSDELSALVSSAAGTPGAGTFAAGGLVAGLSALIGSPFLLFFLGLLTVLGTMTLWLELVVREAAVYVVVLMLPLAFAALVWPARRVWASRAVELLVALILSKFAIVAVLSLGGAALDQALGHSFTAPLIGLVLVMMGAFAPWVLLRLIPLAEVASAAVGSVRGELNLPGRARSTLPAGVAGEEWAARATAEMRRASDDPTPPIPKTLPAGAPPGDGESSSSAGDEQSVNAGPAQPAAEASPNRPVAAGEVPEPTSPAGDVAPDGEPAADRTGGDGPTVAGQAPAAVGGSAPPAAGDSPSSTGEDGSVPPRHPGMPEMWQGEDEKWANIVLGWEGRRTPQAWPPEGTEGGADAVADPVGEETNLLPPPQAPPAESPPMPPESAEGPSGPDDAS